MIWMLYLAIARTNVDYKEYPDPKISYNSVEGTKHLDMTNAVETSHGIIMKSSSEKGSIVSFNQKNPNDNWSFQFTFNNLNLSPPQMAGLYLWYTNDKLKEGSFKGVQKDFKGMMAGIEFNGKSVELVLGSNNSPSKLKDPVIFRDSINHRRIEGVRDITLKVISTDKNFRIEIYNKEKLLYDNLRFENADGLGDKTAGKYFSLSSYYTIASHSKRFILESASLNKREEYGSYDPLAAKSSVIDKMPRMVNEVMHSNKDTRYMISTMEIYIKYIKSIVGDPAGMPIASATANIRHGIQKYMKKIKKIKKLLSESAKEDSAESLEDVTFRLSELETKLKGMKQGLEGIYDLLVSIETSSSKKTQAMLGSIAVLSMIVLTLSWRINRDKGSR